MWRGRRWGGFLRRGEVLETRLLEKVRATWRKGGVWGRGRRRNIIVAEGMRRRMARPLVRGRGRRRWLLMGQGVVVRGHLGHGLRVRERAEAKAAVQPLVGARRRVAHGPRLGAVGAVVRAVRRAAMGAVLPDRWVGVPRHRWRRGDTTWACCPGDTVGVA